jgi:hypothetical protein
MSITPPQIDGATVILWTPIDGRHHATGGCRHSHHGQVAGAASWLAICRFDHPDTNRYSDTLHDSVEDAKHQAAFEYEGISTTWVAVA